MYASPLPMYMSSRMPMTSAMKEIMVAVSRTSLAVGDLDFFSSRKVLELRPKN